jgi:hypothetical protein
VEWFSMALGLGEGTSCVEHGNETESHKTQWISWLDEKLLASWKGIYSVKLIIYLVYNTRHNLLLIMLHYGLTKLK